MDTFLNSKFLIQIERETTVTHDLRTQQGEDKCRPLLPSVNKIGGKIGDLKKLDSEYGGEGFEREQIADVVKIVVVLPRDRPETRTRRRGGREHDLIRRVSRRGGEPDPCRPRLVNPRLPR